MTREPKALLAEPDALLMQRARDLAARAPLPAQVGAIVCGTAGWTDPTLITATTFYPESVRTAAQRLAHYATHFALVEVDSTFYAIAKPQVAAQWAERTPPAFVLDIKAHPVFTGHPIDRNRLPADLASGLRSDKQRVYPKDLPAEVRDELIRSFRALLGPLQLAGKLGCVMVQLPPWITATRGAMRQLENLPSLLPDVRLAVEFRHPSWLDSSRRERVFDALKANGLAYVSVDEPNAQGGGVPAVVRATRHDLGLVRFHGHNVAGWHKGASVAERFNYLYSPEQLASWVEPIRRLSGEASCVHAVFNNCVRDFAVLGAKDLAALLTAAELAAQ
jgi:uncharacterized protein YecE (DUF72 family)